MMSGWLDTRLGAVHLSGVARLGAGRTSAVETAVTCLGDDSASAADLVELIVGDARR
jgi:hypothetical protein